MARRQAGHSGLLSGEKVDNATFNSYYKIVTFFFQEGT